MSRRATSEVRRLAPYSPPTDNPCSIRAKHTIADAAGPMAAWLGVHAIRREPADISSTDAVSAALRPFRSAKMPISHAPIGRMTKPTAKTAAALRSSAVASFAGKKTGAK
ncbi:MAG: hypothetical protein U0414_23755 [Polyangiaceae bacterium]